MVGVLIQNTEAEERFVVSTLRFGNIEGGRAGTTVPFMTTTD